MRDAPGTAGGRRTGRATAWQALAFTAIGTLAAEAAELLRLRLGGIAAVPWDIRLNLWVAYAIAALALYGLAVLVVRGRRRPLWLATALLAALIIVPWVNFDYLPTFWSVRSLASNLVLFVALAGVATVALRFSRGTVAAVLIAAVAANAMPHGGRPRPQRSAAAPPLPAGSPNVLLVLLDTLRADHLGAYGYHRTTSPAFDRLAAEGVLFERAAAQAAWTKPSATSLFTSTYVHRHGVIGSRDMLRPDLPVLAEELAARGYQTAAFSANPWITAEFGFDRGFEHFESANPMGIQLTNLYHLLGRTQRVLNALGFKNQVRKLAFVGLETNIANAERDDILVDDALRWLGAHGGRPFFVYLHLMGPHDPYDPPAEYVAPFRDTAWGDAPPPKRPPARVQSIFETAAPLGREELAQLVSQYDGAIRFTDALVGRLVDGMTALGLLDRTLLVIVSDHGEEFHEHGNWRHGNQMYDEIVHVPMLFRLPGKLPGTRRGDPAMLIDVFPSIFGLLDLPLAAVVTDGRNLFASGAGAAQPVFAEQWRFEGGEYVSRMVRSGTYKFIETRDESLRRRRAELYDLSADPDEQRDLLQTQDDGRPEATEELRTLLSRFGAEGPAVSAHVADPSRATEERLRQLGY